MARNMLWAPFCPAMRTSHAYMLASCQAVGMMCACMVNVHPHILPTLLPHASSVPQVREGLYYNPYFPGGAIAMPKMLVDGGADYDDGTPSSASQQAKDVSSFLAWASYPYQVGARRHARGYGSACVQGRMRAGMERHASGRSGACILAARRRLAPRTHTRPLRSGAHRACTRIGAGVTTLRRLGHRRVLAAPTPTHSYLAASSPVGMLSCLPACGAPVPQDEMRVMGLKALMMIGILIGFASYSKRLRWAPLKSQRLVMDVVN